MNSCTGSSSSSSSSWTGNPLINLGKGVKRPLDDVDGMTSVEEQRSGTMPSYVYLSLVFNLSISISMNSCTGSSSSSSSSRTGNPHHTLLAQSRAFITTTGKNSRELLRIKDHNNGPKQIPTLNSRKRSSANPGTDDTAESEDDEFIIEDNQVYDV